MGKIYVTALRSSPQQHADLAVPRVQSVEYNDIVKIIPYSKLGVDQSILKITKDRYKRNMKVSEKYGEVILLSDFTNAASSPYNTGTKLNLASGNGATQAAATAKIATAYHNSVTVADATSTAVSLPSASLVGNIGSTRVVKNAASVNILVWPQVGEFLDAASVSTGPAVTIKPNQFKHFYCASTTKWVTCKGPYI